MIRRFAIAVLLFCAGLASSPVAFAQTINCTTRPDLCNRPVSSEINSPVAQAHDIVFLGDGYTSADLEQFAITITSLIDGLKTLPAGRGFVDLDPTLFNYHRIDVASQTNDLSDADLTDTAFGSRGTSFDPIRYDATALLFAAAQNAPDADTVVLVINTPAGRANALKPTSHISGGRTVISIQGGFLGTLVHELGHAMFMLGDEYADYTACYEGGESGVILDPNLTSSPLGEKFTRAYSDPSTQPSPVEGGGLYSHCIYRPAATCRMRSSASAWCPVCGRMVRTLVEERRHGDDRDAPYSALSGISPSGRAAGVIELFVRNFDSRGVVASELWIDDVLRPTDLLGRYLWDTTTEETGVHRIRTQAFDASGKSDPAAFSYDVTVFRDSQAPELAILSPASYSTVSGFFEIHATATDDFQLDNWEVHVDGRFVTGGTWGRPLTSAEFRTNINSANYSNGRHTVLVLVEDNSKHRDTWVLDLNFANAGGDTVAPTVTLTQPNPGQVLSDSVTIAATAEDNVGVSRLEVLIDGGLVATRTQSPYTFVWDTTSWPNGNHTIQARAFDAAGNSGVSDVRQVTVSNTTRWPVLFVVGAKKLTPAELAIQNRLTSQLGAEVTVIPGASAKAASAQGASLVVISPSVKESAVKKKFRRVTVPVLCMNARLFDELALTLPKWGTQQGTQDGQSRLKIITPTHPLAAGLSGNINAVTNSAAAFSWGKPAPSAVVAATLVDATDKAASFGYESGTVMVGKQKAVARRTGLFATEQAIAAFDETTKGWRLFDAAVLWTANR